MATYVRTFSSGEKKTSTANEVIEFNFSTIHQKTVNGNVEFLAFKTFTSPCSITLNDEDTVHWIDADSEIVFQDIYIDKFTIIDSGVEYYYTAMSTK